MCVLPMPCWKTKLNSGIVDMAWLLSRNSCREVVQQERHCAVFRSRSIIVHPASQLVEANSTETIGANSTKPMHGVKMHKSSSD